MVDLIGSIILIAVGLILVYVSRQVHIEDWVNKLMYIIGAILVIIGVILLIVYLIFLVI